MLLKDNEEKRNIAWRTVMTVTSVLIILIVVFFAVKLFNFQSSDRKLGEHR